jgi:hypothetical protein
MSKIAGLLATLSLALSLSACASLQSGGVPTAKDAFDRACAERPTAYDALRPVKPDVRRAVNVANNQIAKLCAEPPENLVEGAAQVSRAIVRIRNAIGRS